MRHPTDGTLRRLLDEPEGVADADREHVAGCPVCLAGLQSAREDAAMVGAALSVALDPDVDAAWLRLSGGEAAADERVRVTGAAPARRWRSLLRSPAIAAFGVGALLAGAGAAAAADWLQIFRTEEVRPLTVSQADLVQLPDLSDYGDIQEIREAEVRQVDTAADAEARTGLKVPQVDRLPRGVTGQPTFQTVRQASAVFTFSADKAAEAAREAGQRLPPPPAGLDGSRFRMTAGPGLAVVWAEARGLPALIVGRAVGPTAASSGIPFDTARDYMLSLPGLPADVVEQLRSFTGDGTTLPLVVPTAQMTVEEADVRGAPATVFKSRDGLLAGVIWVDDGKVTVVAGSLSEDEVLDVARGLRWGR